MNFKIPPINNHQIFEAFCKDLFDRKYPGYNFSLYGRRGQKQKGIDLYCIVDECFIGVQCKVRENNNLSTKEILDELENVKSYKFKIDEYIIVTTNKRDTNIQDFLISIQLEKKIKFKIEVLFWEDISKLLMDDNYKDIYFKYYKVHFVKYEKYGCFIGKTISITTSENNIYDTYYEFMIGKTSMKDNGYGLDYFNNRFFIVSLRKKLFSLFSLPINNYNLRIIGVDYQRDQKLITDFFNKPDKIDEIIY